MTHSLASLRSFALAGALAAALFAPEARAGIADCGQINVEASAKCEAKVNCTAECTPVNFEAACAGQLEGSCETECANPLDVSCTTSCEGTCNTKCTANPGTFDCEGECTGTCGADCDAKCSGMASATTTDGGATADAKGTCLASCKATCGGECHGKCTGTPPSADCSGKCKASCSGSCTAKVNVDCQATCQAKGTVTCQDKLTGGCQADCSGGGGVFCDGQYVDSGGHAQQCIDAIDLWFKEHVDVSATGSASSGCGDGGCHAEAQGEVKASTKCSVTNVAEGSDSTPFAAAIAGFVGLAVLGRRKRV